MGREFGIEERKRREPMSKRENRKMYLEGLRDGVPIGLGYFAVAFSLGIAARSAGLSAWQGLVASLLCSASAGEYALFTLIGAGGTYLEAALVTLITNARYLLMSCALSQRISPRMPNVHRFLFGAYVTDELFGINIARPGALEPVYYYGAISVAIPLWSLATALGIVMGNLLPGRVVSALSVALYGMFLAIIIPPARENRVVAACVGLSFALSWLFSVLPGLAAVSAGTRTILLTLLIAGGAAALFPVKDEEAGEA